MRCSNSESMEHTMYHAILRVIEVGEMDGIAATNPNGKEKWGGDCNIYH